MYNNNLSNDSVEEVARSDEPIENHHLNLQLGFTELYGEFLLIVSLSGQLTHLTK